MTWYSNEMQIVAGIIWFFIILIIVMYVLVEADTIPETLIGLFLILIVTLGLFKYAITADAKQNESLTNKYKYRIEVIKGKYSDVYYTNEYTIKNGVVYFNNRCANNFSIETLK